MADISQLLLAKSDQSNAADLIGAPVVGRILRVDVNLGARQQHVSIWMDCLPDKRPWKPCKTAMRILSHGWGPETDSWVGRRVGLYYEEDVTFEGKQTGGIRVEKMSHLSRGFRISLASTRGKYRMWEVAPLGDDVPRQDAAPPDLDATLADLELSSAEVDAYLVAAGRPPIADLEPAQRVALAVHVRNAADKIRARRTP
jgi:hypothetical protein